jgi:hypothetical protein
MYWNKDVSVICLYSVRLRDIQRITLKKRTETSVSLNTKCPILTKFGMFQQISIKVRDIRFNETPFSTSRVVR